MNNIDIVDMDILRDEAFAAEVAIADFEGLVGDTIYTHGAGDLSLMHISEPTRRS